MPDRVLRILVAATFLLALTFALARYGGTEERVLYAIFLIALPAAVVAGLRIDPARTGRWQWAALAIAGVFLCWRVTAAPALEASGQVFFALGWMSLLIGLWLSESRRMRRFLIACVIVAGAAEALYGLAQALGGIDRIFEYERGMGRIATGTLINRNHFAALLNMGLGLGLGLLVAAHARGRVRRSASSEIWARAWLVSLACAVLGLAVLLSRSRGGILTLALMAVFVGVLLCVSARIGRSSSPPPYAAALFLLVTLLVGLLVGLGSVAERFTGGIDDLRPVIYRDTLRLIADHPWTGVGAGMYGWRFQPYQSAPADQRVLHAHSDYLELAAEWGVPVALLLVMLVVRRLHGSARTFLAARDPLAQGAALGCAAAMFGVLVHSVIDFNLKVPANLMLFTMILAAAAGPEASAAGTARRRAAAVVVKLVVCVALLLAGWRVWSLLSAHWIADGDASLERVSRALTLEPTDPRLQARLGVLYRDDPAARDLERSRGHLERAVELNPWNRRHHFELARTYEELAEWRLAEEAYARATAGLPILGRPLWHLARFHLFNGDRERMYEHLRQALDADRSLLIHAVAFLMNTETSPEWIDRIWPEDPYARLQLLRGLRLRGAEQRRRYLAFAVEQWTELLGVAPPTLEEGSFFVRELLAAGETDHARRQWSALAAANEARDPDFEAGNNAIWNGGFELPLAGHPLGWQLRKQDGVSQSVVQAGGDRVMSIVLSGENLTYGGLEQMLVLAPGVYDFEFEAELDGLTTDEGLYFEILDPAGRRRLLETEPLLGSAPRRRYTARFEVPEGVEMVAVRLMRRRSLRIDSRIRGRLLLDDVAISPTAG